MLKNKGFLILITVIMLVVTSYLLSFQTASIGEFPLEVAVVSNEETVNIKAWENETGDWFFFLPAYADLDKSTIRLNSYSDVLVDGEIIVDGMNCAGFQINVPQEVSYVLRGKTYISYLTFVQSADVATMYIETQSGNMDFIHEKKGNEESGTVLVYTVEGKLDFTGNVESIKGRGNYSWLNYEKKPYSLKFTEQTSLLGMGISHKWVLLANAGDPSNIRNKFIYDFADSAGLMYSPDSRWVDLYLNGDYTGLYLLTERNEVTENRIDIRGDNSFLISQEIESKLAAQNIPYISTNANLSLRIHYPQAVDDSAASFITAIMQSVENAIISKTGMDTATGKTWSQLIDTDSWVKKYLVEEVFGNGDAGSNSQFFYYDASDQTGKVYAGPVWDYDRTMGNPVAWQLVSSNVFYANRLHVNSSYDTPWLFYLSQKEPFSQAVAEQYEAIFLPLLDYYLTEKIYNYAEIICQAAEMNQLRWGYVEETFEESVENIVQYMYDRITFLNKVWLEEKPYHRILADQSFGSNYTNYIVFSGETLTSLPVFEDTDTSIFCGWYYSETNEPFDITKPITEDTEVYARWETKQSQRLGQIGKLIPLGVLAVMGFWVLTIDIRRMRKNR